uniref:Uncharacterized protein n=1 Tax=Manihot esculenta TaxID=3983 RepID=A0A2C9UGP7_MANES
MLKGRQHYNHSNYIEVRHLNQHKAWQNKKATRNEAQLLLYDLKVVGSLSQTFVPLQLLPHYKCLFTTIPLIENRCDRALTKKKKRWELLSISKPYCFM